MDKLGVLRTTVDPVGGVCAHWSDVVPRCSIIHIHFDCIQFFRHEGCFCVSTPCLFATQRECLGLVFGHRGRQQRYRLETYVQIICES